MPRVLLHRLIRLHTCGLLVLAGLGGCPPGQPAAPPEEIPLNTTDPTNGGATYVTSAACDVCHFSIVQQYKKSGHNHILNRIVSNAPAYPPQASRAGVPDPPAGFSYDKASISFVVGGYLRKANFLDGPGFLLTDGTAGTHTQWNLVSPPAQIPPQFVAYAPAQTTPLPYSFDCFRCHVTGPSPDGHQMGLAGIQGTWAQDNVQCEACHGPGSRHISDPPRNIYINPTAAFCGQCHSRQPSAAIQAADGFLLNRQQYQELLASPHAAMRCTTCHNPHASSNYDPANALVNDCQNCHFSQNMALHRGKVLTAGDYMETLTCHSCHMPFATRSATAALTAGGGRIGDMRTHLFRINPAPLDYTAMFNVAGDQVRTDTSGQAALTLDFVCLRCHNGQGNAFALTVQQASNIATGIHQTQR